MTTSYYYFIILSQFKIRQMITLQGCHLRIISDVHILSLIRSGEIEGVNRFFNVNWARCIHIQNSLWPRPNYSSLLDNNIEPITIVRWVSPTIASKVVGINPTTLLRASTVLVAIFFLSYSVITIRWWIPNFMGV